MRSKNKTNSSSGSDNVLLKRFADVKLFDIAQIEKQEVVQRLWQGYGYIYRVFLSQKKSSEEISNETGTLQLPQSVIIKYVAPPKNLESDISHNRKSRSYQVELCFYEQYASRLNQMQLNQQQNQQKMVPKLLGSSKQESDSDSCDICIVLEDLDALGYSDRKGYVTTATVKPLVKWLARFHAEFLVDTQQLQCKDKLDQESQVKKPQTYQQPLKNQSKSLFPGLWEQGCYWHLDTRPDELNRMSKQDPLRKYATILDNKLKNARYQTLLHGDAKIENFCFGGQPQSELGVQVTAVDFQYCGSGVGVRDLAYMVGSCMDDNDLAVSGNLILEEYLEELTTETRKKAEKFGTNFDNDSNTKQLSESIKNEWRELWPICFADFERFLAGWSPGGSWGRSNYAKKMIKIALEKCSSELN